MFQFLVVFKFQLVSICFTYLVSKFTIYFNWYQNIKYFLSLVSKCTSVSISIGITNFLFHMVSKYCDISNWFVDLRKIQNLYFLFTIGILKFCLCTNDISKFVLLPWVIIKICVKDVLIYIVYMQRELNISSIYRFILSVSYIEEVDISSLCDTRV